MLPLQGNLKSKKKFRGLATQYLAKPWSPHCSNIRKLHWISIVKQYHDTRHSCFLT